MLGRARNAPLAETQTKMLAFSGTHTYRSLRLLSYYRVIDGLDTLDDLEKLPVNEKSFRPLAEKCINNVTIHANPIADAVI